MNWLPLPSGQYLNLDRAVVIRFHEPHFSAWETSMHKFVAVVVHSAGTNIDFPGSETFYDDDARFLQAYLSDAYGSAS